MAAVRLYYSTFIDVEVPDDVCREDAIDYGDYNAYEHADLHKEELYKNLAFNQEETEYYA